MPLHAMSVTGLARPGALSRFRGRPSASLFSLRPLSLTGGEIAPRKRRRTGRGDRSIQRTADRLSIVNREGRRGGGSGGRETGTGLDEQGGGSLTSATSAVGGHPTGGSKPPSAARSSSSFLVRSYSSSSRTRHMPCPIARTPRAGSGTWPITGFGVT